MLINIIQIVEFLDQFRRAFLPDTRHAGDIVGTVPLDGFDID